MRACVIRSNLKFIFRPFMHFEFCNYYACFKLIRDQHIFLWFRTVLYLAIFSNVYSLPL